MKKEIDSFRGNVWQPMRELLSLQRGINRLFDDVPTWGRAETNFTPTTEVEETDSQWLMKLDLPGVKKDEINIEINNGALTVSGEFKEEHKETKKSRYVSERIYGNFMRSFVLPDIKPDQIDAVFENGVLTIAVPKAETAKVAQI
ncbi:MAG: Hsp20/alpha crystallin family protein [Bdellovibrionia bacterium]